MPVAPTYPGVYIEEIPSGVRTITGVATSIAAFVGTFRKGPLNEAMQVFSMADFQRGYGGLDRSSEVSYAVQQFFLNGGTEAWIVRVADTATPAPDNANAAAVVLTNAAGAEIFRATAGRRLRGESAVDPGTWGNNLRLEVDYDSADPARLFNLTVSEVQQAGNRTITVQTETFRNLTLEPNTSRNALEVVNQGSRLVQLDRADLNPSDLPDPFVADFRPSSTGTLGAAIPGAGTLPAAANISNLEVTLNVDSGATSIGPVALNFVFGPGGPTTFTGWAQAFEAAIRAAARDPGFITNVHFLAEHADYLLGATVRLIGDGSPGNPRRFHIRTGRAARPFDRTATLTFTGGDVANYGLDGGAQASAQLLALVDGRDGPVVDAAGNFLVPVGMFQGSEADKTGIYALEDVDLFNILAIPQAALLGNPLDMRALYAEAEAYVEDRRAMLIIDIPPNVRRLDQMQTWLDENEGLRHRNAALYYPHTFVPDPLNRNRPKSLAASGTIAGLWARTDVERGVWKAPAGTDARLRNVEGPAYLLTDQQNGALNPLGVNCLRNFPIYANICWGARTLEGADAIASDWKYVPVRRTTLFIEESLYRGTKWVVFEPNDEPLWAQIRLNVGAFMQDLFRKGAFQGSSPREAYFVKCDGETTTQQDIDKGIVNIEVGFAPLKPAEFVIIKIQQIVRRPEE